MTKDFITAVRPALVLTVLFALLLGLAYPAALTAAGQLLFPAQANGSLIRTGHRIAGSHLIGQNFAAPGYFHGRPSAAGKGYDATASGGSNLGPTSRVLADRIKAGLAAQRAPSPASPASPVPPDLVTTSASGLDPHISPEAALFQVERVAAARGLAPAALRDLVAHHTDRPLLGFVGEPRVNVLELNRALDSLSPEGAKAAR